MSSGHLVSISINMAKNELKAIKFCWYCGYKYEANTQGEFLLCKNCKKRFYPASTPAVGVIIPSENAPNRVLLTTRNIDPGKGLLDLPGGFLNYAETVEAAAQREIKEELNIKIKLKKIICSNIQFYNHQGIDMQILDILVLSYPINVLPIKIDKKELIKVDFYNINEIKSIKEKFAFNTEYNTILKYRKFLNP